MNLRYHIVSKRSEEEDESESNSSTVDSSKTTTTPINSEIPVTTSPEGSAPTTTTPSFILANVTTTSTTATTTTTITVTPSVYLNNTVQNPIPANLTLPLVNQTNIAEPTLVREVPTSAINPPDNNMNEIPLNNKTNNGLGKGIGISIGVSFVVLVAILSIIVRYRRSNIKEQDITSKSIPVLEIEKSEDIQSDSENKDNIPYYNNDTSFNYNTNESFYTGAPTTNTDPYSPVHTASLIQRKPTNQATVATNSSITCTNNYNSSNADYNANPNDSFSGYPNWNQSSVNNSNMIINHENNVPYSRNISSAVAAATMGTNPDNNTAQEQNGDKKSTTQIQSRNSLTSSTTAEPLYRSAQSPNINRNGSRNESCIGQVNAPQNDSLALSQIRNSQTESLSINTVHSPRIESFIMPQGSRVISPRIGSLCMKNSFIDELRSEYSTYERPSMPTKMEGSMISLTMPRPEESYYANSPMCNSIKDSFFSNRDSTVLRNATLVPEFVESSVVAEPMVPEIIETISSTAPDSPHMSFEESSTNGLISTRRLSFQPPRTGYLSPEMQYQKHLSLLSLQSLQSLLSDNSNKQFLHNYDTLNSNVHSEKVKPFVIEEESGVNITVEKKKRYTSSINDNQNVDELNFQ